MNKDDIRNKDLTVSVRREVAIMKALRHKNIVSLHRVLSSSTRLYIIMDLVYGSDLEHHIAEAEKAGVSLSEDKVRIYFRHIVDGVVHCHERRVYHRDLKPQNILLRSEDDHIFITDFGVSGIKGVDSTTDLLTTQCGTPTYIAPEIISHAGAGYSGEKVDCWALGVILFFMLTGGKLPFDDDRLEMLFDKIQTSAVEYPERISADASESHDSSFSWGRLVGGSRDGGGRSQLGSGAVAAPTALAVKGLKRLGFAPRTVAEPGAAAAAGAMGVSAGNSSGLVFESAMSRDRCMTTVGRLLVDDLFCDVLSRTDGGHSKLRCSLPNQKNEWPIKIYFEPIGEGADGGGGGGGGASSCSGSGARRSKAPSPRLAQTVVVMSKGRASDLTPAQLRGFYDQVMAKFRASAPDAVVSPMPSSKPWR
eukprot:contig_23382_g5768